MHENSQFSVKELLFLSRANMNLKTLLTLTCTCLSGLWTSPAAAYMGNFEGLGAGLIPLILLAWAFVVGGIVIVTVYSVKYLNRGKPGHLFRMVTIVWLLLGSYFFILLVFSPEDIGVLWTLYVALYFAVLTIGVLSYFNKPRYVLTGSGAAFVAYLLISFHIVSFTAYQIVDNQAFEPTHILAKRHGASFVRTANGDLYRFLDRMTSTKRKTLFKLSPNMQLTEVPSTESTNRIFDVNIVVYSNDYYRYRRYAKPIFIAPLRTITIQRNVARYARRVELLSDDDWTASTRDIQSALYPDCCEVNWIKELIEHGADPTGLNYGGQSQLHLLGMVNLESKGFLETAATLIEAGVDVNHIGDRGYSVLYEAVRRAPSDDYKNSAPTKNIIAFLTLLLEAGADPNMGNPLYTAIIYKRYTVAKLLLEYGANPHVELNDENEYFSSAFDRASGDLKRSTDDQERVVLMQLVADMQSAEN